MGRSIINMQLIANLLTLSSVKNWVSQSNSERSVNNQLLVVINLFQTKTHFPYVLLEVKICLLCTLEALETNVYAI